MKPSERRAGKQTLQTSNAGRLGGSFETETRSRSKHRRNLLETRAQNHAVAGRNDILPKLELLQRRPEDLLLPPRNIRAVDEPHVQEVMRSINTLGFCDPLLIDIDNRVLDGVARLVAAQRLGLSTIPCICVSGLTATEKRLLRLALNRLGEKGIWVWDELKIELQELVLEDAPIEVTGLSAIDLDHINISAEPEEHESGPLAPEPDAAVVAREGDVFLLGEHIIVCGDSTDPHVLDTLMAGEEARLLLTDQPYNVPIAGHVSKTNQREFVMASGEMDAAAFGAFNAAWLGAAARHVCDGGILGTFIDWRGYPSLNLAALSHELVPINLIVWAKTNGGMGSLYRSQHELLPLFKKGAARHVNNVELGKHGRWRSNVWRYPGASSLGSDARKGLETHPTVKPVAMLEDALIDLTARGDIVLDPFLGSGSTLIAAEKCSRRCRAVELDPRYVDVAIRRYELATGTLARLKSTGESFAELAALRALTAP